MCEKVDKEMDDLSLTCLFCEEIVRLTEHKADSFQSHLQVEHGIFCQQRSHPSNIVFSLLFLNEKESEFVINKLQSRIDHFLKHGDVLDGDVFQGSGTREQVAQRDEFEPDIDRNHKNQEESFQEREINRIQELLQSSDSESDEEVIEKFSQSVKKSFVRIKNIGANVGCGRGTDESTNSVSSPEVDEISFNDLRPEEIVAVEMEECRDDEEGQNSENLSNLDINEVNLAEKLVSQKLCKLCFLHFPGEGEIEEHESLEHTGDRDALKREHFTVKDLVFSCDLCPQIPGFLTENILLGHKKNQHRLSSGSNTSVECCNETFKKHSSQYYNHKRKHSDNFKFQCHLCYKRFEKQSNVQCHMKVHKNETEFLNREIKPLELKVPCRESDCNLKFLSLSLENYHSKEHREVVERVRDIKEFEDLKIESFDKQTKMYFCKLCFTNFKHFSHLNSHLSTNHSQERQYLRAQYSNEDFKFNCDECELAFLTDSLLIYHKVRVHITKEKTVKCNMCSKLVKSSTYIQHKWTHSKEKKFQCELCYMKFKAPTYMKKHQATFHKTTIEQEYLRGEVDKSKFSFQCKDCNLIFLTSEVLQNHVKKQHTQQEIKTPIKTPGLPKKCKLCYREMKFSSSLTNHLKLHKEDQDKLIREISNEELVHSCGDCGLKFSSSSILRFHSLYGRRECKTSCKLCYKTFKHKANLRRHEDIMHKEESEYFNREIRDEDLKFICILNGCDKRFVSENLRRAHSRKHDQPKSCKLCYRAFKNIDNLRKHEQLIHKDDVDYLEREIEEEDLKFSCASEECDKRFVSENVRKYHARQHDLAQLEFLRNDTDAKDPNSKNYKCKLCLTKYKDYYTFLNHVKAFHKDDIDKLKNPINEKDLVHKCSQDNCDLRFVSEEILTFHMSKAHKKWKRSKVKSENQERYCQLCFVLYKAPQFFEIHKNKIHSNELEAFENELTSADMRVKCKKCKKCFYSENTLNYHMRRKHGKALKSNSYPCKLCYSCFSYNSLLKKHLEVNHQADIHLLEGEIPDSLLQYLCSTCTKKFASHSLLKYHTRKEHKQSVESSFCKLCYINFNSNHNLEAHKKNIHTSKEEVQALSFKLDKSSLAHKCKFCLKKFLNENVLRYHFQYSHKEERRKDMSCKFCHKVFKWTQNRKTAIKNHMKNVHDLVEYQVDEFQHETQNQNSTVENFRNFLNSFHDHIAG